MSRDMEEIERAANRLHHVGMMYAGSIIEYVTGEAIFGTSHDRIGTHHVRSLIDAVMMTRAEVNALTKLLLRVGVSDRMIQEAFIEEYGWLAEAKADEFSTPDVKVTVTNDGLDFKRRNT